MMGSASTMNALAWPFIDAAKAASSSSGLRTSTGWSVTLRAWDTRCASWRRGVLAGLAGFQSKAMRESLGTVSVSSSTHFPPNQAGIAEDGPVTCLRGQMKLATSASPTGSRRLTVTMGISHSLHGTGRLPVRRDDDFDLE